MGLGDLTSRQAVLDATAEFDRLGRQEFLAKYGFGRSREYFLLLDDQRYDFKAIAERRTVISSPTSDRCEPRISAAGTTPCSGSWSNWTSSWSPRQVRLPMDTGCSCAIPANGRSTASWNAASSMIAGASDLRTVAASHRDSSASSGSVLTTAVLRPGWVSQACLRDLCAVRGRDPCIPRHGR